MTVPENKKEEIRRQLNEEVYPALSKILQTLDSLPENAPSRLAFEAAIEESLARARIAEAMLANDTLDETDDKLVTQLADDKLVTEQMEAELEDRDEDDGSRSE